MVLEYIFVWWGVHKDAMHIVINLFQCISAVHVQLHTFNLNYDIYNDALKIMNMI